MDDKRQITAVFGCSLSGDFLPVQLIYKGTTKKCCSSQVCFPQDWHIIFLANHWSNTETMIDYVNLIIVPYIQWKRQALKLCADHPALVIFDVFKGQCQEKLCQILEDNNIYYIIVPANCMDQLQPLDLSVNKPVKDFMRSQFQQWYGNIICEQLQNDQCEPVDM